MKKKVNKRDNFVYLYWRLYNPVGTRYSIRPTLHVKLSGEVMLDKHSTMRDDYGDVFPFWASEPSWAPYSHRATTNYGLWVRTSLEVDGTLNIAYIPVVGLKTPHIIPISNIFGQILWYYFLKHVKVEDIVHFDICYAILENIVNLILYSILSLSPNFSNFW